MLDVVVSFADYLHRYKDTWEQIQKRREAAVILDNPELLMMHAQARFDVCPLSVLIPSPPPGPAPSISCP